MPEWSALTQKAVLEKNKVAKNMVLNKWIWSINLTDSFTRGIVAGVSPAFIVWIISIIIVYQKSFIKNFDVAIVSYGKYELSIFR